MLNIKVNITGMAEVQRRLDVLAGDLRDKAMTMAINKTADKARAEIARAIPEEFNIKASEVRSSLSLQRARAGGEIRAVISLFGSASKRGRSLNMIHFLASVQAAGKAVKTRGSKAKAKDLKALKQKLGFIIKRGGGVKGLEGAFLGNKGRTIFERVGKGRLPIRPVQVIGVSQMFNSRRISTRVLAKINADLLVEAERAVKAVLR